MLFNSWEFLLFFPIVTGIYFVLPYRFRWMFLLVASCVFYCAFIPVYLSILFGTILVDYCAAIQIAKSNGRWRLFWLMISIIATCMILFFFKYYDFVVLSLDQAASLMGSHLGLSALKLILPIGLSFHVFQSLSYVIEVYRGNQKPERHFGIYALYVMFYPQLVAGPIERPQNLLHQFHEYHPFDYQRAVSGLQLMAWGLFKKSVIADRLAQFVNPVYANPSAHDGGALLVATIFFSFQIFCDFSGYSDMARGAARIMGFDLMLNFDRPYAATSLSDFWRRWHISLSTWLRDYIFEPLALGMRNWGMLGIITAFMVTFFVSGLWHGANWTFVIWGLMHGVALSCEAIFAKQRRRLSKAMPPRLFNGIMLALTFGFVSFTYIFFRAQSLDDATLIVSKIAELGSSLNAWGNLITGRSWLGTIPLEAFVMDVELIVLLICIHRAQSKINLAACFAQLPWYCRWTVYQVSVFCIAVLGIWLESKSFIYFQF